MKVQVILNPYANRWGARSKVEQVKQALQAAGVQADLVFIPAPGGGIALAREAALAGYDAVIAAGGDGTVNEVVNGLIAAAGDGATMPMGVLPIGTGNDFNDMAGLPRDLMAAAQVIARGKTKQVDAGKVNDRYFDNNCAVAMEPLVTIENVKMTRLSGNIRYIVALVKALIKLQAWDMRITLDNEILEGPAILLSVCNSPRTGGLFYMAPDAKMDDGLFDVVYAPEIPKRTVLAILPRLFKGSHVHHPAVTYTRSSRVIVESRPGTPIHADGEVLSEGSARVEYQMFPGKITLLSA
ncbi:MAG: diacylglycerol kinase family lipid kinase [Candidatus Promineifilaceae bacterium]